MNLLSLFSKVSEIKQWRPLLRLLFEELPQLLHFEVKVEGKESMWVTESKISTVAPVSRQDTFSECYEIVLKNHQRINYNFCFSEKLKLSGEYKKLFHQLLHITSSRCQTTEKQSRISHEAWQKLKKHSSAHNIIAESPQMKECLSQAKLVSSYLTPVLIHGESGTGKELLADFIHRSSPRHSKEFVKVNCGAIPSSLIESTLFGHEKGAFSGALQTRRGYFERAAGGTLFLDEVAELSPAAQVRLLRVLENGDFERVGSEKTLEANIRLICASHQDLEKRVADGYFREDLYFRINTFQLKIAPLRQRRTDLLPLSEFLIKNLCERLNISFGGFAEDFNKNLLSHDWPGNTRELRNELERALILAQGNEVNLNLSKATGTVSLGSFDEQVKEILRKTLEACEQKVQGRGGAAESLKLNPQTLYSKMRKHGL